MTYPSVVSTGGLSGVQAVDTVVTGSRLPTVSLAQAKQYLRKVTTADDPEITDQLNSVLTKIAEICVPLAPVTVTDTFDGDGSSVLILSAFPATAITSVTTYSVTGVATVLAEAGGASGVMDGYRKNLSAGTLTRIGYRSWPRGWGNIVVVYTAGPASVPADVLHAVKVTMRVWWESRRLAGNLRTPGGTNGEPGDLANATFGIPEEAYDLLQNWLKPPRIA